MSSYATAANVSRPHAANPAAAATSHHDRFDFGDSTEGLLARLKQVQRKASTGSDDLHTLTLLLEQTQTEVLAQPMDGASRPERRSRPTYPVRVGDVIKDRFVLEQQIGRGGMGRVFRALDKRKVEARSPMPYVAVKVMAVPGVDVESASVAMDREVHRSQSLSHPHIVRVNDFDRDGDTVFATMELLEGSSLRERIDAAGARGIGGQLARRIVRQSAEALAYAHANGILHADFKPSNVFITKRGDVKVIDFGIARAYQPETLSATPTVFDPQALGGLTPTYASPEMLERKASDPRDDVYALGCVAYEIFTGHHPFARLPATQARDLGHRPARPAQLSRREWAALKRALSFDRASRMPSVKAFLAAFNADGAHDGAPPRRTFRLPMVAAALLLSAVASLPISTLHGLAGDTVSVSMPSPAADPAAQRAEREPLAPAVVASSTRYAPGLTVGH